MSQNVQILTGIYNVNFMFYFDKSGKSATLRKKKKTKKIKLHSVKDFFYSPSSFMGISLQTFTCRSRSTYFSHYITGNLYVYVCLFHLNILVYILNQEKKCHTYDLL
jgi:hypothetical protein